MAMKVIETTYRGCRFRSRTEARWAVFLDALGLGWEYEKEGYVFDGVAYLPDFWLPGLRVWLEVKGAHWSKAEPTLGMDTPADWKLCEALCRETARPVAMLFGDFQPLRCTDSHGVVGSCRGWTLESDPERVSKYGPVSFDDGCWSWGQCPHCGEVGVGMFGEHGRCECQCVEPKFHRGDLRTVFGPVPDVWCGWCGHHLKGGYWRGGNRYDPPFPHPASMDRFSPRLLAAYDAARGARFDRRK